MFGKILHRGGPHFPIFVFTSLVAWKLFASGVRNAIGVTLSRERQMRNLRFPKVIVPLAVVSAESVRFCFGIVVVLLAAIAYGIRPDYTFPLVFLVAAIQLIFALGVAFLLSALNVFFRDIQHMTQYIFQAWFFLSPVFYALSTVPQRYRVYYDINPFATILPAYHSLLLDHQLPDFSALGVVAGASVLLLVVSFVLFVRLEPLFAKVN